MNPKAIRAIAASLCLAIVANACALPETSQVPGNTLEQPIMSECPTPTPEGVAMMDDATQGGIGEAIQPAASPAEPLSGEAIELTAQQALSREQMLDRVNAGPSGGRGTTAPAAPAPEGSESQPGVDPPPASILDDSTPTPCP